MTLSNDTSMSIDLLPNQRIWAVLYSDPRGWRAMPLDSVLTIGSGPDCDLRLQGGQIERRHALLRHDGRAVTWTVLGAALGGPPRPQPVQAGQVLRVGRHPLVLLPAEVRHGRLYLQQGELHSCEPVMWQAFAELALAAQTPWSVLLHAESGCGKELAARVLHAQSSRAQRPWIALNCAMLTGDTLHAELFGAVRGAYTGSTENRKGAFEQAHGGTLFLDEVGELPPAAQAALLRVLETGEIQVLGGSTRKVDVRIVAATHRDLSADAAAGRFRLDLLHRLAVTVVALPALRQRPDDLAFLLEDLLQQPVLAEAALVLAQHDWRGNVRELRNFARRLWAMAPDVAPSTQDVAQALQAWVRPTQSQHPSREAVPLCAQARLQLVSTLRDQAVRTRDALQQSGLPRGTFFRYWKMVHTAHA